MPVWTADIELTVETAHEVVSGQFPEFAFLQPIYLGRGWDNFCVLYSNGIVFRLPTRASWAKLVPYEVAGLDFVANRLPVPTPVIEYQGKPSHQYPHAFFGYRHLVGITADRMALSVKARGKLTPQVAKFLRVLHALPVGDAPKGIAGDWLGRSDPAALLLRIKRNAHVSELPVVEWAEEQFKLDREPFEPVFNHGDLYARHLMIEGDQLAGVIDWGDCHIGCSAIDLSVAYSFVPPLFRREFFIVYGEATADTHRRAKMMAANYGLILIDYGRTEKDEAIHALGEQILRELID